MYHEDWIDEIHVNEWAVFNRANVYDKKPSKALKTLESLLLLKTITLLDLSTLFGDDSFSNVTALVNKSVQPLCRSLLSKVLNNVITLVKNLNNATVQKTHSLKVNIDTKDEIKITVKVTGNTEIQINDKLGLNYEDFVEVKQLLKAFHLDNDITLNDSLEKFLSLKNDQSDCHNEPKKTIRIAAICIYPAFVGIVAEALKDKRLLVSNAIAFPNDAKNYSYYKKDLKRKPLKEDVSGHYLVNGTTNEDKNVNGVPIASVAAAFPTGLYPLESKIKEIHYAVKNGATEIDIVISRYLVLGHRWYELFDEIQTLRKACGNATMKTILAVGECGSLENVYKASMVAMMAGTDFIKTSTGKEAVNATFASGLVMCRAIKTFYLKTGKKIGFKPAGGVRTAEDSLKWINLVVSELGADWLSLFRIGASSVLKNIEQRLKELSRD